LIGAKGLLVAAKTLALSAMDILEKRDLVKAARADSNARRARGPKFHTLLPGGEKPATAIR
jgi:hypothetical protein